MKKLKFMLAAATAIGLATASQADVGPLAGSTSFEGDDVPGTAASAWITVPEDFDSEIVTTDLAGSGLRSAGAVSKFGTNAKALKIDGGTVPLTISATGVGTSVPGELYVDTLVKFTVTPAGDSVDATSDDKLMIYLKDDGAATNLYVKAGFFDAEGGYTNNDYQVILPEGVSSVEPNTWYRLTVKSLSDVGATENETWAGFQVFINGGLCRGGDWGEGNPLSQDDPLAYFLSLQANGVTAGAITSVGFAGSGTVDDVLFTTFPPEVTVLDFTLVLATGSAQYIDGDVSYDTGIMSGTLSSTDNALSCTNGNAVVVTYTLNSGCTATWSPSNPNAGVSAGTTYTLTVAGPVAEIAGTGYATLAEALAGATAGQTVKLLANATAAGNAISTAAGTLDLNGNTLTLPQNSSKVASLTFTGTGAATLKGGDLTGVYHELDITAPAGENLTLDGMTFHASVKPNGSGDLFTATNCQFLCDCDKTGAAFADGSSADVHSYGVMFNSNSLFTQADIVDNYFDQGRRAAVQASFAGDLYFYGNTVVADKLTSRVDGADTRYPALQTMTHGRVFIENNTFSGQYLGEAFCLYNKGAYRSTDAAVVFSGNTVGNGVNYLWGIYDVDKSGSAALVNPNLYFGANVVGENVNTTQCIYKTTVDGVDVNSVTYSHTPATLALPAGVDSVYAWTHAAGATDYDVDGSAVANLSSLDYDDVVIAVPGADVSGASKALTLVAPYKNKWTAESEPQSGEDLAPGQQSATTYDSLVAAEAAAANVTIVPAAAVSTALGAEADNYVTNFEATVVAITSEPVTYAVQVGLKASVEAYLQDQADADAAEVIEDLSESTVTIQTMPGFYYSFEYGTTLEGMTEGARTLATGSTLELTRPTTPGATAGFYKVLVNIAPAPAAQE